MHDLKELPMYPFVPFVPLILLSTTVVLSALSFARVRRLEAGT